ncbi:MAG: polyprenol monophosphomannose synthase [Candidatus Zixiibacteriota bacterium]
MNDDKRALIIFPTYNEKDNIEKIIAEVLPLDSRINILIVDDNSPDGTGEIADRLSKENSRINVLHRTVKEGLGRAYIAGFKWAIEHKFDFIFEMDADFSHNPKYVPDFLKNIEEYDLILGSRYISGVNVINWPMGRLLLSYYANVYTRIITGMPLRDATGGFKCFRREVLETIDLDAIKSNGYVFQIELSMRVWKNGFKIKEIPIVFADRVMGESKMSKKIVREAIWKVWYLRLMSILGKLK